MRLRLYENHRFVLYAPFYAAHAIGAYAAEGLAVELLPSPGMGLAEQALLDGAVDVLWAGPMRVMKHHDANPGSALVCFAEIVCRDPFSIVGRSAQSGISSGRSRCTTARNGQRSADAMAVPAGRFAPGWGSIPSGSTASPIAAWRRTSSSAEDDRSRQRSFSSPSSKRLWLRSTGHLWHAASARGRTTYTAFVTTRGPARQRLRSRCCAWSGRSSGPSNGSTRNPRRRSRRRSRRSSHRLIVLYWQARSPATRPSRSGDATRSCPRTALIACGERWSRAVSSAGRRLCCMRRQQSRPASRCECTDRPQCLRGRIGLDCFSTELRQRAGGSDISGRDSRQR